MTIPNNPTLSVTVDGKLVDGNISLGRKEADIAGAVSNNLITDFAPIEHIVNVKNTNACAIRRIRIYFKMPDNYFGSKSPEHDYINTLKWINIKFDEYNWITLGHAIGDNNDNIDPSAIIGSKSAPIIVPSSYGKISPEGFLLPEKEFTFKIKIDIPLSTSVGYDGETTIDTRDYIDIDSGLKRLKLWIGYSVSHRWTIEEHELDV